jgi:regulator of Ty1 transposition protein 109
MKSTTMASQTGNIAGASTPSSGKESSKPSSTEYQLRQDASKSKTKETMPERKANVQATEASAEPQPEPAASVEHPPLASSAELQSTTVPFHWPEAGRGDVVLSEADYKTMMDGVLDHFYDADEIVTSTKLYIDQVASLADELTWGKRVAGTHSPQDTINQSVSTNNILDSGLIRKRKKPEGDEGKKDTNQAIIAQPSGSGTSESTTSQPAAVNVLSAGLVRKKKKT